MWDRREVLYRGLEPAADPWEAVDRLIARGIHLSPVGPYRVKRTLLRRPDPATGRAPPPESEEITVEGAAVTIATDTIRFLKHREVAGRHLFALSYEQTLNHVAPGRRVEAGSLILAEQTHRGWLAVMPAAFPAAARPT